MKICWDNLEGVYLTCNGTFRKGHRAYIYKESCMVCGEPYLTEKNKQSDFCGQSCAIGGRNNPMYGKTRIVSVETRKKLSIINAGKNNPMYGKTLSVETKKKISVAKMGTTLSVETRKKISKNLSGVLGPNYKGGVSKNGLTTCDTHKDILGSYEEIRKQEGTEVLEVKCTYCGRWYTPTYVSVKNRIVAINNLNKGECRFYCSENCKLACPIYHKRYYPKGFKHTSSREVSTYLRQIVLERDNWICQICGKTIKEVQLHVHHMDPAIQNPMFQNDMDSCITLCKECHKMVHSRIGCRYVDLRCKKVRVNELML